MINFEESEVHPDLAELLRANNPDDLGVNKPKTLTALKKDSQMFSKSKEGRKILIMKEVSTLSDGDSFGELALMSNKPRAATIYCKDDPLRKGKGEGDV